jgi:hypothetical protein
MFTTSVHKAELTVSLTPADAEQVRAAVVGALSAGREAVAGPAWDLARNWASDDCLYSLAPPDRAPRRKSRRARAAASRSCPVRWVPGGACGYLSTTAAADRLISRSIAASPPGPARMHRTSAATNASKNAANSSPYTA